MLCGIKLITIYFFDKQYFSCFITGAVFCAGFGWNSSICQHSGIVHIMAWILDQNHEPNHWLRHSYLSVDQDADMLHFQSPIEFSDIFVTVEVGYCAISSI